MRVVPGLLDFLGLHTAHERRVAVSHLGLNLAIVAVQIVNFWIRGQTGIGERIPMLISVVAVAALVV